MSHGIAILVYDGVQALDVFGPADVFDVATRVVIRRQREHDFYQVQLLAERKRTVTTSVGARVQADGGLDPDWKSIDTLIIPGGETDQMQRMCGNPPVIDLIRAAVKKGVRLASISDGAEILAAAGALDGHQASTHWAAAGRLRRRYEQLQVVDNEMVCEHDQVFTSGGITAGINLALKLVEADLGRSTAVETARMLVIPLERRAGQLLYSDLLDLHCSSARVDALLEWLADKPRPKVTIDDMAHRCQMTTADFRTKLDDELDLSGGELIERARVTWARQELENAPANLAKTARRCGFKSAEALRRAFRRYLHCTPTEYGETFVRRPSKER
jgi:transcriptional regulator GlxA family with amidase domain